MTNVADRHWGLSLVRAPTAKDAANPAAPPVGASPPLPPAARPPTRDEGQPTLLGRATTVLGRSGAPEPGRGPTPSPAAPTPISARVSPAPAPPTAPANPVTATATPAPLPAANDDDRATAPMRRVRPSASPVAPAMPRAVAAREPTVAESAVDALRTADPTPALPTPTIDPAAANPRPTNGRLTTDGAADPSLARLARGIQDCARALSCLGDRLDHLERRLDAADASQSGSAGGGAPGAAPAAGRPAPAGPESLEAMVRALEGMSADRLHGLDQRLRRLETLPASVGRLQKDTAWLSDLATTRRLEARSASTADLAPVHQELESVADMVRAQHMAATQSLDRVRTLERVVLDIRRQLERDLAEHTRVADSGQATTGSRIEGVEARLAAVESCLSPTA